MNALDFYATDLDGYSSQCARGDADAAALAVSHLLAGRVEVAMSRWRLPVEHTDIEVPEIKSARRITATSVRVDRQCEMVRTPGWCMPRLTVGDNTP